MHPHDPANRLSQFPIRRLGIAAILAWTIIAILIALWECYDNRAFKTANALAMARACIEKDVAFRKWAAGHGGVYVPVTDKTPPNPWLNVPERDITTPSGRRLTLLNPAYMTRQIFEISQAAPNTPQGHITSLKPVRPENAPDRWETSALIAFEAGEKEFGEFLVLNDDPVFRYMRPLTTEKACLKCHAAQGYREGMVRGGISITIRTAELDRSMLQSNLIHIAIIAAIWLMGLGGIRFGFRRIGVYAAAIKAERDNLVSVFDATPMPMLLVDDRMDVVRFNSAFREYCADCDSLPDRRCGTLLKCVNAPSDPLGCGKTPLCDSCDLLRALQDTLRSGLSSHGEVSINRDVQEGIRAEKWLLYGLEAVSLDGRNHILLSFMDITERKSVEAERHVRAEEFRALVENSPDIIARYDRHCRRIYVNPAMGQLAGKSSDLLTGRTPTETLVVTPDVGQQVKEAVEKVLRLGTAMEMELSWKDSGGVMRHFQSRYVPEYSAKGEIASVLGITRDITSLRKTEAQLLHAQKMESIGTLAGGVAHDFNNILSVIGGYAELLQLSLRGDERKLKFAIEISDSVVRGAELTRSLLTFSGKHEPQMHYDNLNHIVANLQKSMSRLLRSDITLTFRFCDNQLPVFADRVQIEQVLINLMVNARDAITSGGAIDVTTTLVELCEDDLTGSASLSPGSYALVTFADNGTGMSEEIVKRIFEPFFTTKETGKGTGLGLAIAFGIIGNHNGHISVESTPGKGSLFKVYLPIFNGNTPPKHLSEPESIELRGDETLLLVDDEPGVLRMTHELLLQYGYTVLTASDGMEAVELFKAHRKEIRMVVIDLIMPRMNGREAIERIRSEQPDMPIILTSGYTDDIIDLTAIEALDVVFLSKPVHPHKLAAAIRAELAK